MNPHTAPTSQAAPAPFRLIGVVGGSGSGKSWLAASLREWLGQDAGHLSLDDFYQDLGHLPESERGLVNFDDPAAIDWEALRCVIESLERGEAAQVPIYDFVTHTRLPLARKLDFTPVLVLEGLWLLHPEWLRERYALSVFVDCPEDERLRRRIERDVRERGRSAESVNEQFVTHVKPMHDQFVEPQAKWAMRRVHSPLSAEEHDDLAAACQAQACAF